MVIRKRRYTFFAVPSRPTRTCLTRAGGWPSCPRRNSGRASDPLERSSLILSSPATQPVVIRSLRLTGILWGGDCIQEGGGSVSTEVANPFNVTTQLFRERYRGAQIIF